MQTTKKIVNREQEIIFSNWTEEDFDGMWDKKIYKLKAGKSYYLPFYLAEHFAKHLGEREYNKVFNSKLEEFKEKTAGTVDRRQLEHRVSNSPEVSKLSLQELMDKCVVIPNQEEEIGVVRPKEVEVKEVLLKRDERGEALEEKFPGLPVQVNRKALEQKEEFEEAKQEAKQ